MSDIDLIPARYRQLLSLRRNLKRIGAGLGLVLVALGFTRVHLVKAIGAKEIAVDQIQGERSAALEQRECADALYKEMANLRGKLKILDGLRGAMPAKKMFVVIDRALDGDVWFLDWEFTRAGELVESPPQAVQTGYFLVVPADGESDDEKAWRLQTHMEIRAQARDYAALAGFVRRLVSQPEIEDVRVLETRVGQGAEGGTVDFQLAIVVDSHA